MGKNLEQKLAKKAHILSSKILHPKFPSSATVTKAQHIASKKRHQKYVSGLKWRVEFSNGALIEGLT